MKLHLMTWNCNLYQENSFSLDWENRYDAIMEIVKRRLELENSIVALQEIPYKSGETWEKHPIYERLLKDFPEEQYDLVFSVSTPNQRMMSVIIFRKHLFERNTGIENDNRIVACRKEDIIFVAVHMNTNLQEGSADVRKWKEWEWDRLIAFAKAMKEQGKKLVMLGDFNAYVACNQALTEAKFRQLLHYTEDIIPGDVPTFQGGTAIDHVLLNFHADYQYGIAENFSLSDHKYITVEIEL